jgi:hypothetical protein
MADVGTWNSAYAMGHKHGEDIQKDAIKAASGGVMGAMHKGGIVKKTGNYRLRAKERVLTVGQQKAAGLKVGKKKTSTRKRVASKE